jgi:hypothetical protein
MHHACGITVKFPENFRLRAKRIFSRNQQDLGISICFIDVKSGVKLVMTGGNKYTPYGFLGVFPRVHCVYKYTGTSSLRQT